MSWSADWPVPRMRRLQDADEPLQFAQVRAHEIGGVAIAPQEPLVALQRSHVRQFLVEAGRRAAGQGTPDLPAAKHLGLARSTITRPARCCRLRSRAKLNHVTRFAEQRIIDSVRLYVCGYVLGIIAIASSSHSRSGRQTPAFDKRVRQTGQPPLLPDIEERGQIVGVLQVRDHLDHVGKRAVVRDAAVRARSTACVRPASRRRPGAPCHPSRPRWPCRKCTARSFRAARLSCRARKRNHTRPLRSTSACASPRCPHPQDSAARTGRNCTSTRSDTGRHEFPCWPAVASRCASRRTRYATG